MKNYEIGIDVSKRSQMEIDDFIVFLVKCGYTVYMDDDSVCFKATEDDVYEIDK